MIDNTLDLENKAPDNVLTLDIASVKTLQIGYHAETLFLSIVDDDKLTIKEYIGYTAFEYLAKVNANRFKTTIRYGRREEVNRQAYVEIFLPKSWKGEFIIYTQYGHIICDDTIELDRLAAETSEGTILLKEVISPRIRLASSNNSIKIDKAIGFTDIHTTAGNIEAPSICGGAKLETSSGTIRATFDSLNNVVECGSLNGDIFLTFSDQCNINVDGISKTGEITSMIEDIIVKMKPGNVKNIVGQSGSKPFQNVKLSTINGSILLQ